MSRKSQHTHFEDKIQDQVRFGGFLGTCAILSLTHQKHLHQTTACTRFDIGLIINWTCFDFVFLKDFNLTGADPSYLCLGWETKDFFLLLKDGVHKRAPFVLSVHHHHCWPEHHRSCFLTGGAIRRGQGKGVYQRRGEELGWDRRPDPWQ